MLILHRCRTCNQPDYWRGDTGTTAGPTLNGKPTPGDKARTCCRSRRWGPSQTAPRLQGPPTHAPIAEVLPPGGRAPGGATSCDCDDCKRLYAELTARAGAR